MTDLLRTLLPSGRRLVTPELATGDRHAYTEQACASLLSPLERPLPLKALDAVITRALREHAAGDAGADPELAVAIHRALPLTRREAADPGVFRYLAVVRHPQLVRHRWEYRSFAGMQGRFWRAGVRHDSNAFSRWWWIAELTREGDDYTLTRRVLARSVLATHVFVRDLASYRPAVAALTQVLGEVPGPLVEATLRNFGKLLSVRVLESLPEPALIELAQRALELARRGSAEE